MKIDSINTILYLSDLFGYCENRNTCWQTFYLKGNSNLEINIRESNISPRIIIFEEMDLKNYEKDFIQASSFDEDKFNIFWADNISDELRNFIHLVIDTLSPFIEFKNSIDGEQR